MQHSSLWQKVVGRLGAPAIRYLMRLYPPFLGAGVNVTKVTPDFRAIDVEMPLTPLNRNYVGTHFGGSLYTMCDPFFMLMLIENLGPGYVVWDKSASIDFLRPGKGTVKAQFRVTHDQLNAIAQEVEQTGRCRPEFEVYVTDRKGQQVARVRKVLSVKKR